MYLFFNTSSVKPDTRCTYLCNLLLMLGFFPDEKHIFEHTYPDSNFFFFNLI